jgi:hypothetical protein
MLQTESPRLIEGVKIIGALITLHQNYPYLYAESDAPSVLLSSLPSTHLPLRKSSLGPKSVDPNIAFSIRNILETTSLSFFL